MHSAAAYSGVSHECFAVLIALYTPPPTKPIYEVYYIQEQNGQRILSCSVS